jgi:hypothetical protein
VTNRTLEITVKITNSGNEAAKAIAPEVRLGDRSARHRRRVARHLKRPV